MVKLAIALGALTASILFVVEHADAQTKGKATPRELSDAAIEARAKCGQLALERKQSGDEFRASPSPRYVIYTTCMKKEGFRP